MASVQNVQKNILESPPDPATPLPVLTAKHTVWMSRNVPKNEHRTLHPMVFTAAWAHLHIQASHFRSWNFIIAPSERPEYFQWTLREAPPRHKKKSPAKLKAVPAVIA